MIQTTLVIFFLFLIILPWVIAHHRKHYRKKYVIALLVGSFIISLVLVAIPPVASIGGWLWMVGWLAAFILSLTKNSPQPSAEPPAVQGSEP